jgi:hypothetical protein
MILTSVTLEACRLHSSDDGASSDLVGFDRGVFCRVADELITIGIRRKCVRRNRGGPAVPCRRTFRGR